MRLPTIAGLAVFLGVHRDTLYEWAKHYPEVQDLMDSIVERQRAQLMEDGLYGGKEVNATMAIFLLKALHGLKENDPNTLVQVNVKPILGIARRRHESYKGGRENR